MGDPLDLTLREVATAARENGEPVLIAVNEAGDVAFKTMDWEYEDCLEK